MCRSITTAMLGLAFGLSAGTVCVYGQTLPKYLQESGQESGSEEATRQRLNQWTVFLGGGTRDSTWLRFADELGTALDDGAAFAHARATLRRQRDPRIGAAQRDERRQREVRFAEADRWHR